MKHKYLGDSVYAEYNGFSIRLSTETSLGSTNVIFLEPDVLLNLIKFVRQLDVDLTPTKV